MKTLRVLSLGAGVQSTTLALMIEKGEIPMVDAAIFADTGAEPKEVYTHLEWLKKQLSYPVHIVQ
jgi:3'-phosphoadenosine 5'-phosphosulfate sulfotransferase (PAPS reductase)/FAD synthetase